MVHTASVIALIPTCTLFHYHLYMQLVSVLTLLSFFKVVAFFVTDEHCTITSTNIHYTCT